jgi:tRNA pseudouridine38-40 synthase
MRIALGVEYDGGAFYGWQRQQSVITVQQLVEEGLSKIANHPVKVTCAGRTDAGVHATSQVIHFDTDSVRHSSAWTIGINGFLPETVSVRWFKEVSDDFHARFSATARRYRYIIHNSRLRSAILARGVTTHFAPLDHELMHKAAQYLVGKQDFSAFRAVNCQANTPVRTLSHINISRLGDYVIIYVKANAFLHHIGSGDKPVDWLKTLLDTKDRTQAGATAKPNGLYLVDVTYSQEFDLPRTPLGPLFLTD